MPRRYIEEETGLYGHPLLELSKRGLVKRILEQESEIERLKRELEQLRKAPPAGQAPGRTSKNSSLPPSRDPKSGGGNAAAKWGAKPGHTGAGYQQLAGGTAAEIALNQCPDCGENLAHAPVQSHQQHQQVGLNMTVTVTNWQLAQKDCPCCCKKVTAPPPSRFTYDASVRSLAVYLHTRHHLSHARCQQFLSDVFGLHVSKGTLNQILTTAPAQLHTQIQALQAQVKTSTAVLGMDETGYRVSGRNQWLWAVDGPDFSLFEIHPSRSAQVPAQMLGDEFNGIVVCDFYSAYNALNCRKQRCWAHLLRELTYAEEAEPENKAWFAQLRQLFSQAKALPLKADIANILPLLTQLQAMVQSDPPAGKHAKRLHKRIRKHERELLNFAASADIPATNNRAERAIRPAVVHRKVVQCYRTTKGAQTYAQWHSINETARKTNRPLLTNTLAFFI